MTCCKSPQIVLFSLASYVMLLWTVSQNYTEFSIHEILVFTAYALIVIIGQTLILGALQCMSRCSCALGYVPKIVAGIFTAFNLYTLIIIHNARFAALYQPQVYMVGAVLAAIATVLYAVPNAVFQKAVRTFLCVMALFIGIQFFAGAFSSDALKSVPSHFKLVDFVKKPNIYVISLDTLSPEEVIKKNLGLPGIPYDDEAIRSGGRIIPNAFAERIPTKNSLNSFFAMDLDYFDGMDKKNVFIRNKVANPVYEILRHNGYKIGFMYETSYFGGDSGRLDYYGIAKLDGLCEHVEKHYALLGYCMPQVQHSVESIVKSGDHVYPQMVFDHIKDVAKSGEPWFTYAHIYQPGHAKNSFDAYNKDDWAEFRAQFKERSQAATETMHKLVTTIKENDPDAILIIFGDHGTLTSHGLMNDKSGIIPYALAFDPKDLAKDSPMTYKQIVQDRHAVFLAVFPKTFCPEGFRQNPFTTVRIMREVSKCLSDGQDPLPADFQPNDDKWKPYSYSK